MEIWAHPMMDHATFTSCPVAVFGGSSITTPMRERLRGGPSPDPWLSRAFRALRVAANGGALADVLGPLSAAGTEAVCAITAERDAMQAEQLERAQKKGGG